MGKPTRLRGVLSLAAKTTLRRGRMSEFSYRHARPSVIKITGLCDKGGAAVWQLIRCYQMLEVQRCHQTQPEKASLLAWWRKTPTTQVGVSSDPHKIPAPMLWSHLRVVEVRRSESLPPCSQAFSISRLPESSGQLRAMNGVQSRCPPGRLGFPYRLFFFKCLSGRPELKMSSSSHPTSKSSPLVSRGALLRRLSFCS